LKDIIGLKDASKLKVPLILSKQLGKRSEIKEDNPRMTAEYNKAKM
jgi:hypothetical protein